LTELAKTDCVPSFDVADLFWYVAFFVINGIISSL